MHTIISHAIFTFIGTCLGMIPAYFLLRRRLNSLHQMLVRHLATHFTKEFNAPMLEILDRAEREIAILKIEVIDLKYKLENKNG